MDKKVQAINMYKTLCAALDARQWHYEKEDEKLLVHFGVRGDGIDIKMIITVDEDRQNMRVIAPLPFKMAEDKRTEGAVAACAANYGMADGSFDYDLSNGRLIFRMTQPYRDSTISVAAVQYMISLTCAMLDHYGAKFLTLNKGLISVADFVKQEQD